MASLMVILMVLCLVLVETRLKRKWDSIDVLALSTMIYLCTLNTSGTDVDNQY